MLDAEAIERQIRLGEDSFHEFKRAPEGDLPRYQKNLVKEIVAFANAGGGHILIGVEDDGTPSGVKDPKAADVLTTMVSQICADRIRPPVTCQIARIEVRGVLLLVIEVPGRSSERPYFEEGRCYVRDGNRSRAARPDEVRRLIQSEDYHFDEHPVTGATLADLDLLAVRSFMEAIGETPPADEDLASRLRAAQALDREGRPTLTGVLFFAKDVARWLRDARVSAVRFHGNDLSGDMLDRKEIQGRLPEQAEAAMGFLKEHVAAPAHIEGMERVETGIPEAVLREAVQNALVHRDYRTSSQTRIFVFDDRVQISNPGELLNQLTLENIRFGMTQRRNPAISDLANRLRHAEHFGRGIPWMIRLMAKVGLPQPEFSLDGGEFRVVLRLAVPASRQAPEKAP